MVGGSSEAEGRVEIQYNGQWGTICDDLWNINAATVVCRMLGFTNASHAWNESHFGGGNGSIWLDDLFCLGSENSIYECSHSNWRVHNCKHTEDVGVSCHNGEYFIFFVNSTLYSSIKISESCGGAGLQFLFVVVRIGQALFPMPQIKMESCL